MKSLYKKSFMLIAALVMVITVAVGSTLAYVVTQTPSLMNLFVPGFESTGDILITKEIEHPFGSNYAVPEDLSFTFDVSLGEGYASKTVLTSIGQMTCDEHGMLSVSLKPGASIEFVELLSGTSVTVSERQDHAGFTVDEASKSVTVGRLNDTTVSFVNVYRPSAAQSNLVVTGVKEISGREWMDGDSFTFRLDMKAHGSDSDWEYLGEKTVVYDESNSSFNRFDLSNLISSFDEAGTYIFKLSEVSGTAAGMTSDDRTFEVLVSDADMDGSLEIADVRMDGQSVGLTEGSYVFDVTIVNEYLPSGSDEVVVQIHKDLEDLSGQNMTPAGFTFSLYDDQGNLVQSSSATSSTGDTSIRLHYSADDAGCDFVYVLKEDQGTVSGMSYDSKEVQFMVSVVDNYDGTVSAFVYEEKTCEEIITLVNPDPIETPEPTVTPEATEDPAASPEPTEMPESEPSVVLEERITVCRIPDAASDSYSVSFKNTYDPSDDQLTISGDKDLNGRTLDAGEFTFDLIYQSEVIDSVTHDENGYFEFDELNFSQVGTFVYTVKENLNDLSGGITADTAEYTVTVPVTDEGGTLHASAKILDENSNESEIKFVNEYAAAETEVDVMGTKVLDGRALESEDFKFELYETDETYQTGAVKESVYNNAQGEFKFSTLKFSAVDTYYYVVKENSSDSPMNGVTYDSSEYHIQIVVSDDRNGSLKSDTTIVQVKGTERNEVSGIVFNNSYDAKDAVVIFEGLKKLNGASITSGMFSFYLYETDDTFGYDPNSEPLKKVSNRADGTFAFDALTFAEEKTAYYVVIENQTQKLDRVEYDNRVYEITVEVEDHDGQLEAVVTGAEDIVFENTFVPKPSDLEVELKAHKTVKNTGNQTIGPEGFQFVLERKNSDDKSIVASDASGNAVFMMNYSEEDAGKVFDYKLSEVNDGREDVTYSTAAYDLRVEIVLENNTLKAILMVEGEETDEVVCEFENTYHKVIEDQPQPTPKPQGPANTGDDSNVILYALIAIISLLLIVLLYVLKRINRKK